MDRDRLKFNTYLDNKMSIYLKQKNFKKRLDIIIINVIIIGIVKANSHRA